MIDSVKCRKRIGSDISESLIALLQNQDKVKSLPDIVTREHWLEVKKSFYEGTDEFPMWYKGAMSYLASYKGGGFHKGFASCHYDKDRLRNRYAEMKRNFLKQNLSGIEFKCGDYEKLYSSVKNTLIYCDIPYYNTHTYNQSDFDHVRFWEWASKMSANNIVLVSEETAPDEWQDIWEMPIKREMARLTCSSDKTTKYKTAVEKLFIRRR